MGLIPEALCPLSDGTRNAFILIMNNHSFTLHIKTYTGETVRVIAGFESVDSAVATGDALTARTDLYYRTFVGLPCDPNSDEALEWAKEFVDDAEVSHY